MREPVKSKERRPNASDVIAVAVGTAFLVFFVAVPLIAGIVAGWSALLSHVDALAWPIIVAGALLVFRTPLSQFVRGLGQRITKVSVAQIVTAELSIPQSPQPALGQLLPDLQQLTSEELSSDASFLFEQVIAKFTSLGCFVVDLGSRWLTSRLFLFTTVLQTVRGIRCVVFLERRKDVSHCFQGLASPDAVRRALARQYPRLEVAYVKAVAATPQAQRNNVINQFFFDPTIRQIRLTRDQNPDPMHPNDWVYLGKGPQPYWEHARWIDRSRLERDLGSDLQQDRWSYYVDSPDLPRVKRTQAILQRERWLIASVDGRRVFRSLIDRQALLDQLAVRIADALEADE